MVEDDELRVHLCVRLERRVPVALGLLQVEQRTLRAIDGVINLRDKLVMRRLACGDIAIAVFPISIA